jgi:TonB family protein
MQGNQRAAELGVSGECDVRVTIGPHGVPVRFRVVRALGAGMDEEVLQSVSMSTFEPAMKDGAAVPADYDFRIRMKTKEF